MFYVTNLFSTHQHQHQHQHQQSKSKWQRHGNDQTQALENLKKTCNNATSNSYGPRQCFPLVVILKSLLPVIVRADIPQLEDDQAEVFSQSQSSLLGVAASRSHHPELLAVAILKEKAVYHHLEQRWERVQLWCNLRRGKVVQFPSCLLHV